MKITKFILAIAIIGMSISCNKEEEKASTSEELKANAQMDVISDDVSKIVEDQYDAQFAASGRTSVAVDPFLPSCATVSVLLTETTWTRTVTFNECTLPNGNVLNGQIIATGSLNFDTPSYVINYSFVDFYHNDILIEGNRTVTRTMASTTSLAAVHPVATMDINMTATFPSGLEVTRVGTRVREMIEGFDTPLNWIDNIFSITGNWVTTFPSGTRTSTISTPLRIRMNCGNIVRGVIDVVGPFGTASINFGDGTCDNLAVLTINGTETTITLGN